MKKGSQKAPSSRALYRKYRSKSLQEVVGQTHITDLLERSLQQGKIAHAYLLTGPRGVGKTSVARILAHQINDLEYDETTQHPDIIEIDAASNRRIDDIRDLRDKVQIAPVSAKYKVYIIDEVHMLTGESFNAFLKTLEEPPEHVIFILATTDAHKLPVTITSRTQRFSFRSIAPEAALKHLQSISEKEKIAINQDALELIIEHGDGSFRDSISLLDQLSSLAAKDEPITRQLVEQVLGMADSDRIEKLIQAHLSGDPATIIQTLDGLEQAGIAASVTATQLIKLVRKKLTQSPQLIKILNDLIAVTASPMPEVKLLTALLTPMNQPSKTVATSVSTPSLLALEKEATQPKPSEKRVRQEAKPKTTTNTKDETETPQPEPIKPAPKANPGSKASFNWDEYLNHMKENHMAVATILTKCRADLAGDTLTIYTGTAFWKKKLDDLKYQQLLNEGLAAVGAASLNIVTIPSVMPPKDSQVAAVAAIMGGGEEVEL